VSALRPPSIAVRLLVHAIVYTAAATMVLPFLWMIATSLKTDHEALSSSVSMLPAGPPSQWNWSSYAEAVRSTRLDRYYINSTIAAGITTLLAGIHNALAGFALAKLRFRGRTVVLWLCLATMMLPAQVSFIFAYLACRYLGYLDSLQAIIVPFLASGFGIFYMRQAVMSVPDSVLEAGRLDGMTNLELFWHVVRPTIWPAIAALGVFTFVASWNNFFWPLIVIDSERYKTLPLAIADLTAGKYVQSWPVRMASATVLTVPLILVFLLFQRAFVRGIALTGVKE
jgi:multiple sugar transport system permease protein